MATTHYSLFTIHFIKHPVFLSVVSGVLLALSYPHPGWGFLAWVALVPLFLAVRQAKTVSQALGCGYLCGMVFFGISLYWLVHVTFPGWIVFILIQALYLMAFAGLVYFSHSVQAPLVLRVLWITAGWTVLEVARCEIPVLGMEWNLLAYSQSPYPVMIQAANIFGAYGLGFLIAAVNACFFELFAPKKLRKRGVPAALFAVIVLVPGILFFYGERSLAEEIKPQEYLRVSVLQGNIPQSVKWALMAKEKIIQIYTKLTELAALDQPDLIIWPEASFPGYFNTDLQTPRVTQVAREVETPLLVGGLHWVVDQEVYNSAYFINKNGATEARYDKLRLVPFGEYIPFQPFLGWLQPIADALGVSNFTAGTEPVIFRWAREDWPFGVLICFEDVFGDFARRYADHGVKFLVVITNDAWFGNTGAPFQHLDASIFRAVENGVAVVRSANTGISGFISFRGEVLGTVRDKQGEQTFVLGHKTMDLPLVTKNTLYRQGGYLFPYFVFAFFLGILAFLLRRRTV